MPKKNTSYLFEYFENVKFFKIISQNPREENDKGICPHQISITRHTKGISLRRKKKTKNNSNKMAITTHHQ